MDAVKWRGACNGKARQDSNTKSRKKCLDGSSKSSTWKISLLNKFLCLFLGLFFLFALLSSPRAMRSSVASLHVSSGCTSSRASFSQQQHHHHQQQRVLSARPQLVPHQSRSTLAAAASPAPLSSPSSSSSSRPASHLAASTSAPSRPTDWYDISIAFAGRVARNVLLSGWSPER